MRTTLVEGRVALDEGRVVGVDEDALLREAQTLAEQLSEIAGTRRRLEGRWAKQRTRGAAVEVPA